MQPVRVGIDISHLLNLKTGTGFYLANLVAALQHRNDINLAYFTGSQWTRNPALMHARAPTRALLVRIASRALGVLEPLGISAREFFNRTYLRHKFNRFSQHHLDVVHNSYFPLYAGSTPEVLTVFDLSCFRHPETHPAARVAWQRRHLPAALRQASHVITISRFVKEEITTTFGVDPDRITITHCGVGPEFRVRDPGESGPALADLGLTPGKYLLCVSTIEPRKNLALLIRAHGALPATLRREYPLVIAGVSGWKTGEVLRAAQEFGDGGAVRLLGYIAEETLPLLYSGAAAFAYPSFYEGFGLPPLEAMASGVPVAVANGSSLPEVVGDAGLLVDPGDAGAWRDSLLDLLQNQALRNDLAVRGIARAREFTWEKMAGETAGVYRRVAGRN